MARIMCNFFSYSLGHGVDIEVTLPSFTPCNMDQEHSHKLPGRFPVLYLLHGHGNDYAVWHRYTSVDRYAEEKRIAIVTFSVGNKPYSNEPGGDNFYDFLEQELPDFLENYFPISGERSLYCGTVHGRLWSAAARPGEPRKIPGDWRFFPGGI